MFKDKTVFIVGAGASAEFGLPVGTMLRDTIRESAFVEFDHHGRQPTRGRALYEILREKFPNLEDREDINRINEYLSHARDIHDHIYTHPSIDNFIDSHNENQMFSTVGKILISKEIFQAEKKSKFKFEDPNHLEVLKLRNFGETWIDIFARILTEGVDSRSKNIIGSNIGIICFNYDRCIQFYIAHFLSRFFVDLDYESSLEIVDQIKIVHPYGSLGRLPTASRSIQHDDVVGFGASSIARPKHWASASRIRTYSETIDGTTELNDIQDMMEASNNLVFLGFGFHPQNMELLKTNRSPTNSKEVWITGMGINRNEENEIKRRVIDLYNPHSEATKGWIGEMIHIESGGSCFDLMQNNRRNLSAS